MTDSETAVLRKELRKALGTMEEQERRITELEKSNAEKDEKIGMLESKLAYYESSNMSSSTTSLYNSKRKKFRKRRGEKISGGPGEKVEGGDGGDGGDGENKGRRGPPVGHAGASHHNAATHDTVRYMVDRDGACPEEGCRWGVGPMEHLRYTSKLIAELDDTFHWIFFMARIEVCGCPGCGRTVVADTPFLEGSCYGPTALAVIMNDVENNSTDRQIARRLGDTFGHYVSENSIWNARKAVEASLKPAVIPRIKEEIAGRPWVQMDETKFKRGDGKYGYVWVACTPGAVFVLFSPHRSAAVLLEHFGWLRGRALVSDGYVAYPVLFDAIQRCMVHPLRRAEELAVVRGGVYEELYDRFLELYRDLSRLESRAPFTEMEFRRRLQVVAASYPDERMRTHLLNLMPGMLTFLSYPGMPIHNNDAEREIRDGIIPQRNARHKLMTAEGRGVFSTLTTFARTCAKQGISSGRALREHILDRSWDLFEKAKCMPRSPTNPDGSGYSLFVGLDPPPQRLSSAAETARRPQVTVPCPGIPA